MSEVLEKVSCFITRGSGTATELLLFEHPNAGIQIPAGTVELGESYREAALREAYEETGLSGLQLKNYIGQIEKQLPDGKFGVIKHTKVYARPDCTSFDWAEFRRGIWVNDCKRRQNGFVQVAYEEEDHYPDPNYITYNITGWVPEDCLCTKLTRHLFHLVCNDYESSEWVHFSDNHNFRLFWASLSRLPQIVEPQSVWLDHAVNILGYDFGR